MTSRLLATPSDRNYYNTIRRICCCCTLVGSYGKKLDSHGPFKTDIYLYISLVWLEKNDTTYSRSSFELSLIQACHINGVQALGYYHDWWRWDDITNDESIQIIFYKTDTCYVLHTISSFSNTAVYIFILTN